MPSAGIIAAKDRRGGGYDAGVCRLGKREPYESLLGIWY